MLKAKVASLKEGVAARNLLFMGIFIFLISLGEGMTAPAIPLYGDRLGASYRQLGFLMTGYSIAFTVMTITAGRISDRIGRKQLLLGSIILSIIASTGYYLAYTPTLLLVFRTLEGMSRGILWPISEAILADNTTYNQRGKAMGRFTAAYGGGVAIGNLIGAYLMEYVDLRAVFPAYPVLGIIVLIVLYLGISEVVDKQESTTIQAEEFFSPQLWQEIKNICPICLVGFAYSGFLYSIWGLLSKVSSVLGVSLQGIGIIFALFWTMRLLAFLICGEISGRVDRQKLLLVGIILSFLSTGTFILADSFWFLILAVFWGGLGTGIVFPIALALIVDYSSAAYHGFSLGFFEFIMGLGMIIQTALSGILGELGGPNLTYLFTLIVIFISLIVAWIFIVDPCLKAE